MKGTGAIEERKLEEVKKDAYPLPEGFKWVVVDLKSDIEIKEVYDLLVNNYVEDDDAMFRFDYSEQFIRWALLPQNY